MKNSIFKIIATFVLVLIFTQGCKKDFLNVPDPNTPTAQDFWTSAKSAQAGINAIYSTFHRPGLCRNIHFMTLVRSDMGFSTSPNADIINTCAIFHITNYNDWLSTSIWQDCYIGINRANQVLDNVPGISMDSQQKQQFIGEAKFLRGFFYYNLAVLYGNVPITLHTSKPSDYPPTSPQDSVYAQAEKDFTAAASALPDSYDAANVGRATKGAAYAMLGKCYMQQHQYQKALDAFQWLVTGPGKNLYHLVSNYRDNFVETHENNAESVFEIQYAVNPNDTHDDDIAPNNGDLNYGTSIPPFFAPRPIGFTDGQARRWVVWQFLKEKTVNGLRDPRLAASFLYDSTNVHGPDSTMVYGRTWTSLGYSNDPTVVPNNNQVCFRKFLDDATMNGEVFHSGNNWRYIRYADVLLLYAEALNDMNQTTEAYQYVDQVRERAGLAPLSQVKPGMNQQQFLDQLNHERITELAGEGHRWDDLERWGYLTNQSKIDELAKDDPDFKSFVVGRDEFLPIPQTDRDLNPNITQNPGY